MNNNTTQEKQKSNTIIKILSAILCVVMIVSIIFNVYQFNVNNTLRSEIAVLQSETETLKTDRDTLSKEIENKQTTVSDLSLQIEDLNNSIETLKAENQSLLDSLKSLDDGINSTHTDVELGEDEYQGDEATDGANITLNEEEQAAVNRIEENLKKKHPEWFTNTPSTGTGEGNYEHVGTPDTGELTNPGSFGSSGQDGINKDATVY